MSASLEMWTMNFDNKYYSYYTKTNVNVNMIIQTGQLFINDI